MDRVDCSGVMEVSWNNRLYLFGINFVSLGCVGTTTRVVKMRSWNPGAIGERRALGRPYLVLYTPARMFFYCDRILRLHWDCNRIEDCSRIVGNAMDFEHGLDGFL